MGLKEDLDAIVEEINVETTLIAGRIESLLAQLANTSITPAQREEVMTSFRAEIDRLKTLGANPDEPVPEPTPQLMKARQTR